MTVARSLKRHLRARTDTHTTRTDAFGSLSTDTRVLFFPFGACGEQGSLPIAACATVLVWRRHASSLARRRRVSGRWRRPGWRRGRGSGGRTRPNGGARCRGRRGGGGARGRSGGRRGGGGRCRRRG